MITEALDYMDHQQAIQLAAAEKYFLDELSPEIREAFEEHFFDCRDCATDLRATARFIDAAKKSLKANPIAVAENKLPVRVFPKAAAWLAIAACVLIITYQSLIVFPRLKSEVAELKKPEILPSLSLVAGNSRGGQIPAVTVETTQPFLLQLDIPTQDRFQSYTCLLYSPAGSLVWQVGVSAQAARDTVSIRVPAVSKQSGDYTLTVRGNEQQGQPGASDLAHYRFTLNSPK